jgi:hypothetical protein
MVNNNAESPDRKNTTQLFTLRLWFVPFQKDAQPRGKIQHFPSNEVRYFQGWSALIDQLDNLMMDLVHPDQTSDDNSHV